jgi:putative glycosyltransferase (TIGR04372 family)
MLHILRSISLVRNISRGTKFAISFVFAFILRFFKIQIINVDATRIGHLAMEPELLRLHLSSIYGQKRRGWINFALSEKKEACNEYLYSKLSKYFYLGPSFLLGRIQSLQEKFPYLFADLKPFKISHFDYSLLDSSPPPFTFSAGEDMKGQLFLSSLGIHEKAPYVCLAVRDSSYLNLEYPNTDWSYHNYRDSHISDYLEMAEFLALQGYFVLRMGRNVSEKLVSSNPRIIDYANLSSRSDFNDVYLFANCEFVISTSTGMDRLGLLFRKPIGLVNLPLPQEAEFLGDTLKLVMYKDVIDLDSGLKLAITNKKPFECRQSPFVIGDFAKQGLSYSNNTPLELKMFASEFISIMKSKFQYPENLVSIEESFLGEGYSHFDIKKRSFHISPAWLSNRANLSS